VITPLRSTFARANEASAAGNAAIAIIALESR
jgi:hypothetical protein